MNVRQWLALGFVALGLSLAFGLVTLPGLQLLPMCCVRRYAVAGLASARPVLAMLLPLWPQIGRATRP